MNKDTDRKINMIQKELEAQGYKSTRQTHCKNGVDQEILLIELGTEVHPILYVEKVVEENDKRGTMFNDITKQCIKFIEASKREMRINEYLNKDYILRNIYVGMQKTSAGNNITKPSDFEGIECYLYVRIMNCGETMKMRVNNSILELTKISEKKAWQQAELNTCNETKVQRLDEYVLDRMGIEAAEMLRSDEYPCDVFIVTNKCGACGASSIINKKEISKVAKELGVNKLVAVPCSIHEWLLLPDIDADINSWVKETNMAVVDEDEQLASQAYTIEVANDR